MSYDLLYYGVMSYEFLVMELWNYGDLLSVLTPSQISIILQIIRKLNSIIVLLFIQNIS